MKCSIFLKKNIRSLIIKVLIIKIEFKILVNDYSKILDKDTIN